MTTTEHRSRITTRLRVVEVFDTIQGEGPFIGRPATFLRLGGCNLACSWCDTPYSWNWDTHDRDRETHWETVEDLRERIESSQLVVITGGEPLLQRAGILSLLDGYPGRVQIETNGTRAPGPLQDLAHFVVSPKLANAGDPPERRIIPNVLHRYGDLARLGRASLKIVVTDVDDIEDAEKLRATYGFPRGRTWLMPEGATYAEHVGLLQALADPIAASGLNLAVRLHLIAWPNEVRGR